MNQDETSRKPAAGNFRPAYPPEVEAAGRDMAKAANEAEDFQTALAFSEAIQALRRNAEVLAQSTQRSFDELNERVDALSPEGMGTHKAEIDLALEGLRRKLEDLEPRLGDAAELLVTVRPALGGRGG